MPVRPPDSLGLGEYREGVEGGGSEVGVSEEVEVLMGNDILVLDSEVIVLVMMYVLDAEVTFIIASVTLTILHAPEVNVVITIVREKSLGAIPRRLQGVPPCAEACRMSVHHRSLTVTISHYSSNVDYKLPVKEQ